MKKFEDPACRMPELAAAEQRQLTKEVLMLKKRFDDWAQQRGYRLAWGPASLLREVRADLDALRKGHELDPSFSRCWLNSFEYLEGLSFPDPLSVVLVAVPRPAHIVSFQLDQVRLDAVVPPTYVDFDRLGARVGLDLKESVFDADEHLAALSAPLKTVASRLGLIAYGRNNLSYVDGFGSYFELVGFLTDAGLPLPRDWSAQSPASMPECGSCDSCLQACPTCAIADDRFLLHAERCLVHYNEREGPWPEGLPASVHHCLIGCMACQAGCPQNADLLCVENTGVSFTHQESKAILECKEERTGLVWQQIRAKLKQLDMQDDEAVLGRNLKALAGNPASRWGAWPTTICAKPS